MSWLSGAGGGAPGVTPGAGVVAVTSAGVTPGSGVPAASVVPPHWAISFWAWGVVGIVRRDAAELIEGDGGLARLVQPLGAGDGVRRGRGGCRRHLRLGVGKELILLLKDEPGGGGGDDQHDAAHHQEEAAGPLRIAAGGGRLASRAALGLRLFRRLRRHQDLFLEIAAGGGQRRRHGRRRGLGVGRLPGTGRPGTRHVARVELLEVFARREVAGLDRQHLLERLAGGFEVAGLQVADAVVEHLLDLPLGLRLELARSLDAAGGLLMVDVDQEDTGPGVDGALRVAGIVGGLTLVQQLLDAPVALGIAAAEGEAGGHRRGLEGRRDGHLRSGREGRRAGGRPAGHGTGAEGLRDLVDAGVRGIERPCLVELPADLVDLPGLERLAGGGQELEDVRLRLHPLLGCAGDALELGIGGDGRLLLLRPAHQLLPPALVEQRLQLAAQRAVDSRHTGKAGQVRRQEVGELEAQVVEVREGIDRRRGAGQEILHGHRSGARLQALLEDAGGLELRIHPQHEVAAEQSLLAVAVPSQLEGLLERAEDALLDLGRKGRVPRVIHQRIGFELTFEGGRILADEGAAVQREVAARPIAILYTACRRSNAFPTSAKAAARRSWRGWPPPPRRGRVCSCSTSRPIPTTTARC